MNNLPPDPKEWPSLPGTDATYEEIKRYATVRATAAYFLAFNERADLIAELRLSPADAWTLAEETYEKMLAAQRALLDAGADAATRALGMLGIPDQN
jgi:hypothetical protein